MSEQGKDKPNLVSIYWRKRHTVEKMISSQCSLQVGTDYTILSPEKRNIDNYTGIIITLKGVNAVINKTRIENIFNFKDIKATVMNPEKAFILDLRNISPSNDELIIPVVKSSTLKTDIAIKMQLKEVFDLIVSLHSLRKIIGLPENNSTHEVKKVFNYFNSEEVNLAIEFFEVLGFTFDCSKK